MTEPEENEVYREILKKIKEKDDLIESQKQTIEQLKEVIEKHDKKEETEEKSKTYIGYCDDCGEKLTAENAREQVCPFCGKSKSFTPY